MLDPLLGQLIHSLMAALMAAQVSLGLAVVGLEEGSEFVPIFCPDGAALESHVTLFDKFGGRCESASLQIAASGIPCAINIGIPRSTQTAAR